MLLKALIKVWFLNALHELSQETRNSLLLQGNARSDITRKKIQVQKVANHIT